MTRIVFLIATTLIAGCAAPPPIKLDSMKGERYLDSSAQIPVRANSSDCARIDTLVVFGKPSKIRAETGPTFCRLFSGKETDSASIVIKNSTLVNEFTAMGFAGRITYRIEADLITPGRTWAMVAQQSSPYAINMEASIREAVETTIMQLAREGGALISKN